MAPLVAAESISPVRKKVFISIQNEASVSKGMSSHASHSPLKLKGRKLTDTTPENEAVRQIIAYKSLVHNDQMCKLLKKRE